MGRLITRAELLEIYDTRKHRIDATWYISDAHKVYGTEQYNYVWPSESFPYFILIHNRLLDNDNKIRIRQWIEINLVETVICECPHHWNEDYSHIFHFEYEHSVVAFKLAFSDLITVGPNRHRIGFV